MTRLGDAMIRWLCLVVLMPNHNAQLVRRLVLNSVEWSFEGPDFTVSGAAKIQRVFPPPLPTGLAAKRPGTANMDASSRKPPESIDNDPCPPNNLSYSCILKNLRRTS
jgi:hypothetical protein